MKFYLRFPFDKRNQIFISNKHQVTADLLMISQTISQRERGHQGEDLDL